MNDLEEIGIKKFDLGLQTKYKKYTKYKELFNNAGLVVKNSMLSNGQHVNLAVTQSSEIEYPKEKANYLVKYVKRAQTGSTEKNNRKQFFSTALMNLKEKLKQHKLVTEKVKSYDVDEDFFWNRASNYENNGAQTQRTITRENYQLPPLEEDQEPIEVKLSKLKYSNGNAFESKKSTTSINFFKSSSTLVTNFKNYNLPVEERLRREINSRVGYATMHGENKDSENLDLKFNYIDLADFHKNNQKIKTINHFEKTYKKSNTGLKYLSSPVAQRKKNPTISYKEGKRNREEEGKSNVKFSKLEMNKTISKMESNDTDPDLSKPMDYEATNLHSHRTHVVPIQKDSTKSENRYEEYIKIKFKDRKMPKGYRTYLRNLKLSSELNGKKLSGLYGYMNTEGTGFLDVLSNEILKSKNPNKNSGIYKKLEKNEKLIFGLIQEDKKKVENCKKDLPAYYLSAIEAYKKILKKNENFIQRKLFNKVFSKEDILILSKGKKETDVSNLKKKFKFDKFIDETVKRDKVKLIQIRNKAEKEKKEKKKKYETFLEATKQNTLLSKVRTQSNDSDFNRKANI